MRRAPDELDRVLYDLVDGLRVVAVALAAYIPETAASILAALRQSAAVDWSLVAYGLTGETSGIEAAPPLFPRLEPPRRVSRRSVIDTHAHLDGCDEPAAFLVERARAVGVSRIVTVGTGIASCRAALAIAEAEEGVSAALGIDPHQAGGPEAARLDELAELLAHPSVVAVGETGLDYFHDLAPRAAQRALFDRQLELAACVRPAGRDPHPRRRRSTRRPPSASFPGTVILHCFSAPGLLDTAIERGYYVSFAGNVTYPKAAALREAAAAVPADRILAETDSPYLSPQPLRGKRNEPANVLHTLAVLAQVRGEEIATLEKLIDRNASAAFGLPAP